jgi:hypothetical protein
VGTSGGNELVSDVRVAPLLESQWSQTTAQSQYCFNHYTPNNYPSGSVATAMAQLMRYHEHPTDGIGQIPGTVHVDGRSVELTTRGGDGMGGPYDWSMMPLTPESAPYDPQHWQMIGALTHDAGVAVNTIYSASLSGAPASGIAPALKDVFDYSNAVTVTTSDFPLIETPDVFQRMINSNLEAGSPVLLTIAGDVRYEVVCDGYGFDGGTLYHHLNMGWGGSNDAWYNLPNVDDSYYGFSSVSAITYNVFPDQEGQIISGRVIDENGAPLSNAVITAQGNGGEYEAFSNATGYYGIILPAYATYDLTATKDGYEPAFLDGITIPYEYPDGWSGNYVGADLVMEPWPGLTFTACALETSIVLSWSDPMESGMPNSMVYIRRSEAEFPADPNDGVEVYNGTDLTFEDTDLTPEQTYYYTIWVDDGLPYVSPPGDSATHASSAVIALATPDPGEFRLFWRNDGLGRTTHWILNTGGTIKSSTRVIDQVIGGDWEVAGVGDIDRDGMVDLIWRHAALGRTTFWLLNSDGTFRESGLVIDQVIGADWEIAGVGDIDQDGTVDLIWRNEVQGKTTYWLLNSDGTLRSSGPVIDQFVGGDWEIAGLGDIDQDGTVDLIWWNASLGRVTYWLLNSDGTLRSSGRVLDEVIEDTQRIAGVGDIDQDGTADLIWRNPSQGETSFWLLNNDGTLGWSGSISDQSMPAEWEIAAVGDIDRDGTTDLIWRDPSQGETTYWLLDIDGTLRSSGPVIDQYIGSEWIIAGSGESFTGSASDM